MLLCQTRDLRDLGLRYFIRIDTAHAFSLCMDFQHDPSRRRPIQREDLFEHLNDEFHRSVIVVQQYYAIKRWALERGLASSVTRSWSAPLWILVCSFAF